VQCLVAGCSLLLPCHLWHPTSVAWNQAGVPAGMYTPQNQQRTTTPQQLWTSLPSTAYTNSFVRISCPRHGGEGWPSPHACAWRLLLAYFCIGGEQGDDMTRWLGKYGNEQARECKRCAKGASAVHRGMAYICLWREKARHQYPLSWLNQLDTHLHPLRVCDKRRSSCTNCLTAAEQTEATHQSQFSFAHRRSTDYDEW
jgi:hypothetical protein